MAGKIRTLQECPKCKGPFNKTDHGFECSICLTVPTRYFVDIPWKGQRLKIYSDRDSHPLDSYPRALRLLETIRYQIDQHRFDPSHYIKSKLRLYRFDSFTEAWIAGNEKRKELGQISPSYLKILKLYARTYFAPHFGVEDIREITSADIKIFTQNLPSRLSLKYQYNILGVLHKLFTDAFADGYIKEMPQFPSIKVPETYIPWIDEKTQDKMLELIPEGDRPIVLFLMRQATRPSEARALQKWDLDLESDLVVIRRTFSLKEIREYTKAKSIRVLPLDPVVKEALLSLPSPLHDTDFVFKPPTGRPYYPESRLRTIWNRVRTELKLDNVSLYGGTRHSLASQAVNRDESLWKVGKFLGHQDIRQTMKYSKLKVDSLKSILRPQTVRGGDDTPVKVLKIKETN